MSEVKMPEPEGYMPYPFGHIGCYSEEEMKQYGDDRAREALEMSAKEVERMTMYPGGRQEAPAHDTVWHAARAIRAFKEQIK
jgi:hypothetical protein